MNTTKSTTKPGLSAVFERYESAECEIMRRAVSAAKYKETLDVIEAMKPLSQIVSYEFVERHGLMPAVDACVRSFRLQSADLSAMPKN